MKMLEEEGIQLPMITTLHGTDITLVGKHPLVERAAELLPDHEFVCYRQLQ